MATAKTSEKMLTLEDRIAINSAPAWRPQKGDILIGKLFGVRLSGKTIAEGGYGQYPVLVVDRLDRKGESTGEYLAIHAFHTLVVTPIIALLKSKELVLGGDLTVSYLGRQEKKTANAKGEFEEYHNYYVEPGNGADRAETILDMTDPTNFPF